MAADLEMLSSWARHGLYAEIEAAMAQPDWVMPVAYQNEVGVKLLLRRGADVKNGRTTMGRHRCTTRSTTLIAKGTAVVNAEGLACYEGLSAQELEKL